MWRKSKFSCTLAGVLIIGSTGLIVLGLKGYWEPGVPFALALIFGGTTFTANQVDSNGGTLIS